MDTAAQALLNFWFGSPKTPTFGQPRKFWFVKDPAFDLDLKQRFLETYQRACKGQYDNWPQTTLGSLALILVFDQLPRNFFRDSSQAFATDARALAIAQELVASRCDRQLVPVQRWFVYLPFEHSENLEHQHQAVALFEQLSADPDSTRAIEYAYKHRDVIQRFGRFPHRNTRLNRPSTPEELEFLRQPGSRF
jgi:uncharacterized protein (DUF924 family)